MDKENFDDIVLREKEKSLHISRVPRKIKEEFTKYAEEEFAGDYGLLLRELWEKYKEMEIYHTNFDLKLNYIIQLLENSNPKVEIEQKEKSGIKTIDGRELKGGRKEDE